MMTDRVAERDLRGPSCKIKRTNMPRHRASAQHDAIRPA
jgi:hypothetical protein